MPVVYDVTIESKDYTFQITEDATVLAPAHSIEIYNFNNLVQLSCVLYYQFKQRDIFITLNESIHHIVRLNKPPQFEAVLFFTQHIVCINYAISDEYTVYLLNEELLPNKILIVPTYTPVPLLITCNNNDSVSIELTIAYPIQLFKFDTTITIVP